MEITLTCPVKCRSPRFGISLPTPFPNHLTPINKHQVFPYFGLVCLCFASCSPESLHFHTFVTKDWCWKTGSCVGAGTEKTQADRIVQWWLLVISRRHCGIRIVRSHWVYEAHKQIRDCFFWCGMTLMFSTSKYVSISSVVEAHTECFGRES